MATVYNTQVEISLEPVGYPEVCISVGDRVIFNGVCNSPCVRMFNVDQELGSFTISVAMLNKEDNDPDTAIIIKSIKFNGITDPKFLWQGVYYPEYPKHFFDRPKSLPGQTYISWNGVYQLTVTVPIFTWMHQTLDLGWVFE